MRGTKNRFIERYKAEVIKYFNWSSSDQEGRLIQYFISREYERILKEEFDMTENEVSELYQQLYAETYSKERRA